MNQKRVVALCLRCQTLLKTLCCLSAFPGSKRLGILSYPQLAFISSRAKSNISLPVAHLKGKGRCSSAHRGKRSWKFLRRLRNGRRGMPGALSPGGRISTGALEKVQSSPQEEAFEFLADPGAERRRVCRIPNGWEKRQTPIPAVGAKGEGIQAAALKQVMFEGTNRTGTGEVSFIAGTGSHLLGRVCKGSRVSGPSRGREKGTQTSQERRMENKWRKSFGPRLGAGAS